MVMKGRATVVGLRVNKPTQIALKRLFIMSETLQRILKRDKPKAEIVENMTRSFFKQNDTEEAVITIKPNKMTRSQAQNRLYWMIIEQIRKETFNSKMQSMIIVERSI